MKEIDERYIDSYQTYRGLFYENSKTFPIEIEDLGYLNRCFRSYVAISTFFQNIFISKDGYIIDTGNFESANYAMLRLVKEKIEKHPLLWKLFFMIC